jgi:SAM-dependent methyltransferase
MDRAFIDELTTTFERSVSADVFDSSKFFREWYDRESSAYFFLFRKNLKVTNLQFAELIALLRTYIADEKTGRGKIQLLFLSTRSLKDTIRDIVTERGAVPHIDYRRCHLLAELYSDLLSRIVVVDVFQGSAAVFIPPNLTIDLERICGLAGYVHSCGRIIFIRSTDKITEPYMLDALGRAVTRHPPKNKLFLAAYAHEDFTGFDRADSARLKDGLDDVKLHLEKFYVEGASLPKVLIKIGNAFSATIFVPPPGDYHRTHIALRGQQQVDEDRTIWFIVDYGVGPNGERLAQRYLICYDQLLANQCPFQLFDENKPAWVAHTTIPHSMMRAMLNLSLPWQDGKVSLCDPFVGTGTTWLEALKFEDANAICSDLDAICELLVADNLQFFALTPEKLLWLSADLDEISSSLHNSAQARKSENMELFPEWNDTLGRDDYRWAMDLLEEVFKNGREHESGGLIPDRIVAALTRAPLEHRLLFYIGLRAELRYSGAFVRASIDHETAFAQEARELAIQIGRLAEWKQRASRPAKVVGRLIVYRGYYSDIITISPEYLAEVMAGNKLADQVRTHDCKNLEPNSFDVIVADPPYGFNTDDRNDDLAQLYHDVIYTLLRALKEGGQLILCLPDRSHTGRRLPVCTRKEFVIHQVLVAADRLGKEVFQPGSTLPDPGGLFRPPYYWESEKALRRAVLHFHLRAKKIERPQGRA